MNQELLDPRDPEGTLTCPLCGARESGPRQRSRAYVHAAMECGTVFVGVLDGARSHWDDPRGSPLGGSHFRWSLSEIAIMGCATYASGASVAHLVGHYPTEVSP